MTAEGLPLLSWQLITASSSLVLGRLDKCPDEFWPVANGGCAYRKRFRAFLLVPKPALPKNGFVLGNHGSGRGTFTGALRG